MKLTEEEKKSIASRFEKLNEIEDFIGLLNYTYSILFSDKRKNPFNIRIVNYHAFHLDKRYSTFYIPKRNGTDRQIDTPNTYLKLIQKCINCILQVVFQPHHTSHGFRFQRSIVTNASQHVRKQFVLNADIENFFGSIEFRRVKTVLELSPFNLSQNGREEIAFLISNICCFEGVLPQGAPTSPILTNVVCQRLDRKLFQLAKTHKCRYSRYADDITFSSQQEVFSEYFLAELKEIIYEEGFNLNEEKTRIQSWKERQEVTGLIVNRKVNVNRNFIRKIRAIIHNYKHGGEEFAQKKFETHWFKLGKGTPDFKRSLKGQIEYLGMVRGKNDPIYLKYKKTFDQLFSDKFIDYSFVGEKRVKKQLEVDYDRMVNIKFMLYTNEREKFTNYCIAAVFQLEELVNYYFSLKMTIQDLKFEILEHTWATPNMINGINDVSQISIVYKFYLFEKYFYFGKGKYYDAVITKLRIIRNWNLHRNSTRKRTEKNILEEFNDLITKIADLEKRKKIYTPSKTELKLQTEVRAIYFLREMNYNSVFDAVKDAANKIRNDLSETSKSKAS